MARGNQRDKAREKNQKAAASVVSINPASRCSLFLQEVQFTRSYSANMANRKARTP